MTKQKMFEILITAVLSAGIAFLQAWLTNYASDNGTQANPQVAGVLGAGIMWVRNFKIKL